MLDTTNYNIEDNRNNDETGTSVQNGQVRCNNSGTMVLCSRVGPTTYHLIVLKTESGTIQLLETYLDCTISADRISARFPHIMNVTINVEVTS